MSRAASASVSASLHAGLVTQRFAETCEFYSNHFGFAPVEATDEFALLARADGSRLAVLRAGGEGQPAALRSPARGAGVWLAFTEDDPDRVHARLAARGVEIVAGPEFTPAGARRCIARDPNGVLLYISAPRAAEPSGSAAISENHHEHHRHRIRWVSCH